MQEQAPTVSQEPATTESRGRHPWLLLVALLCASCSTTYQQAVRNPGRSPALFSSSAGEAAYRAAYEALLLHWPLEPQSVYVPTQFGQTHVLVTGSVDAPPLVLLHAVSVSSTAWFLNVGPLSEHFRVYAIDALGDCGRSQMELVPSNRAAYADWLNDVFTGLGLERAALLGHSYGGFLAINFSILHPEKVRKLVLLAPAAGIYPIRPFLRFMLRHPDGFPLFRPSVRQTLEMQAHRGYEPHPTFVHLMEMASAHCGVVTLFPQVYTPEELGQIEAPTFLLVGEEEKLYAPQRAMARAQRFIPDLTAVLVPGAGHTLNMERPDMVNRAVIGFLTRPDPAAP
jgi:pimeloyl-ACP methyl ester carboxylesterase